MLRRELTRTQKEFVLPKQTALTLQKLIRARHPDAIVFLYPADYSSYRLSEALPKITELGKVLSEKFAVKDAKTEAASIRKELGMAGARLRAPRLRRNPGRRKWSYGKSALVTTRGIDPVRMKPSEIDRSIIRIKKHEGMD